MVKIVSLLVLLLVSVCSFAQDENAKGDEAAAKWNPETGSVEKPMAIGNILKLRGRIRRQALGSQERAILGLQDVINKGDILLVEKASFIKIKMIDGTIIDIGPLSKFSFDQFDFKSQNERKSVFTLIKGKMRSLIVNKAKPGDLTYKTPHVAMGIRGTEFVTDVLRDQNGKLETRVAVLHGKVAVDLEPMGHPEQKFELVKRQLFKSSDFRFDEPSENSLIPLNENEYTPLINSSPEEIEGNFLSSYYAPRSNRALGAVEVPDQLDLNEMKLQRKYRLQDPRYKNKSYQYYLSQLKGKRSGRDLSYKEHSYEDRAPASASKAELCEFETKCLRQERVWGINVCTQTKTFEVTGLCK